MRTVVLLSLLASFLSIYSQYTDNFSDENFTINPIWSGTDNKFIVKDSMLCLNDISASGTALKAYLSTPSKAFDMAQFSCRVQVRAALTSANYVRFYLTSDAVDLTRQLNGYYIMIGGAQKEVALYRQQGSSITKIIDGTDNRLNSTTLNDIEVKATHLNGTWTLYSKKLNESAFIEEGSCVDRQVLGSYYSGIFTYYSSGNKDKYCFDDFQVSGVPYIPKEQEVYLYDIIINEIMTKPYPVVSLPDAEYIELYNRTGVELDLAGWKIIQGTKVGTIRQGTISPNGYLILCLQAQTSQFASYGAVAEVNSFPALNNASGMLTLTTNNGYLICWLEYTNKWFDPDAFRKDGGWSLERIDVNNLINTSDNWKASKDLSGGTPGRYNSVAEDNSDYTIPEIKSVAYVGGNEFKIEFSKPMNHILLSDIQNYYSDEVTIQKVELIEPKYDAVILTVSPALSIGEIVSIHLKNLKCVSDNDLPESEIQISIPQTILAKDIIINELLFNAPNDVATYIELFNRSDKTLDLSELYITRRRNGALEAKLAITTEHLLIYPKQYLLVSNNIASVCNYYQCLKSGAYIITTLPSMPNAEGNVTLILTDGTVIDEFSYSEKMHHVFITSPKGIALERVNPNIATQDASNWHSAAFDVGYGTPGGQNSQFYISEEFSSNNQPFSIAYKTFTPDNDGYQDLLHLHYTLPESGYILNITIYDPSGISLRRLCNNTLLGLKGDIIWDGTADNGSLCSVGVYVLLIEATHPQGKRIHQKIVCTLGAR